MRFVDSRDDLRARSSRPRYSRVVRGTVARPMPEGERTMKRYDFTLVLSKGTELTDQLVEDLYEAGCDDGSPSSRGEQSWSPCIARPNRWSRRFVRPSPTCKRYLAAWPESKSDRKILAKPLPAEERPQVK